MWRCRIRDRKSKIYKLVQAGYTERVLKTFGMWDCKSVVTPLDPNNRLSKREWPEVIDPIVHHRYRSIDGWLSYLVQWTWRDQIWILPIHNWVSSNVQYPGIVQQCIWKSWFVYCNTYRLLMIKESRIVTQDLWCSINSRDGYRVILLLMLIHVNWWLVIWCL